MSNRAIDEYIESSHASTSQETVICPACHRMWKATLTTEYGASDYTGDSAICESCGDIQGIAKDELEEMLKNLTHREEREANAEWTVRQMNLRQVNARLKKIKALLSLTTRSNKDHADLMVLTGYIGKDFVPILEQRILGLKVLKESSRG